MNDIIIKIEGISKAYHIELNQNEHGAKRYKTLQEDIMALPRKMLNKVHGNNGTEKLTIWALKNIFLEIKHGEVLGIIGRNGSGKSTLLKILSRITEPTAGYADMYGKVGSLLEVGTGFHPELTGRENVYLSGAMLGMRKNEIKRKFDEIVSFAEVEKYIDTPVKRYSSGMYVRLAFAVAAHLETEILLVDEVLSVGDASFQKKCLGKMEGVAQHGRTVLFVSHQMGQISTLCTRSLILNSGEIIYDGFTPAVIDKYMQSLKVTESINLLNRLDRKGNGVIRIADAWVEDHRGYKTESVITGRKIKLVLLYNAKNSEKLRNVNFAWAIYNSQGLWLTTFGNHLLNIPIDIESGEGRIECIIPKLSFNAGLFYCNIMIRSGNPGHEMFDWLQNVFFFTVESGDYYNSGVIPDNNYPISMDHEINYIFD